MEVALGVLYGPQSNLSNLFTVSAVTHTESESLHCEDTGKERF